MSEITGSKLSLVVVTYNSAAVLVGLLDSISAGLEGIDGYEVIVVDNDSRDNSVELALGHAVCPRVIRTGCNAGYAAAINTAAASVDAGTALLILNPDLRLCAGAVLPLVEAAEGARVGIAVPCNLKEDGSTDRTLRREPSIVTAWADAILGGRFATRLGLGEILGDSLRYDRGGPVEWATGSALLVSARARKAAGDWDESYFLYSEEVDYQRKIREAGLNVVYVPHSKVIHAGGDYRVNPRLFALLTTNRLRYFRRYHGMLSTVLFRLAVVTGEALRYWRGSEHRAAFRSAIVPMRSAFDFRREQPD